jgi:hypothetical protein
MHPDDHTLTSLSSHNSRLQKVTQKYIPTNKIVTMPLATSVAVSRMMSQHVNREDVSDDLGTAILNGSSPIIDYEHQKGEH